jgi:hypothetical protein
MDEAPLEAQLVEPVEAALAVPAKGSFASISTFSIILALLGGIGLSLSGGFTVLNYRAAAPTPPPAGAPAIQRFQYELTVDMQGIAQRYTPGLAMFSFWHAAVVVLLFIGGIRVARRSERGRQFMLYVLIFTLLFELLRSAMYVMMMMELMPFIDEGLVRTIRQAGGEGDRITKILERMAMGVTLVMILFALVWPAVKLLFYGWAARYLATRQAIELCRTS